MNCESIQELLLDGESLSEEHQAHVDGCAECSVFARSLLAVDAGLSELPEVPAPEPLVQRTIETVHALDEASPSVLGALGGQLGRGALAVVELVVMPFKALTKMRGPKLGLAIGAPALVALFVGMTFLVGQRADPVATAAINGLPAYDSPVNQSARNRYGIEGVDVTDEEVMLEESEQEGEMAQLGAFRGGLGDALGGDGDFSRADDDGWFDRGGQGRITNGQIAQNDRGILDLAQPFQTTVEGRFSGGEDQNQPARGERSNVDDGEATGERRSEIDETVAAEPETLRRPLDEVRAPHGTRSITTGHESDRLEDGRDEIDARDVLSGLTFQEARGLWSNTYVPGDPRWRLLARELRARTDTLSGVGISAYELAREAEPVAPRIAAPRQSALALSVQSDRAEIEGRTRVLMQVGVRAASSRGRRPTLRSVVVLDLRRALNDAEQAQVRGLLQAISRSRTGADRIGIMVAGPHGGWLVEPGPLRFGEVTVALRQAMAREGGTATDLDDALGTAIQSVNQLSDSDSPLGSGLVWMITPGLDDTRALEGAAHAGALAGVTTTTIGLSATSTDALENVAMAGHGRRWIADADPAELVRSEIAAVSRVVARALRLNVKLAPGVQLVDVLGSRRLDDQSARRARASERALDRQLASRLGISADREDDDDGISILIPAFYADDTHTVLLDLVVDNAGPVADVSLRYKDLLRLDNTEANERLVLPRGNAQRGPAQRDVMHDWLSWETSVALRRAARLVSVDRAGALQQLHAARERIERVGGALRLPRARVRARAAVCARFAEALQAGADATLMADSLRYASRRMLFGDPLDGSR